MIHARDDYDHIQDSTGKIPKDEPVFLLRGQDILTPLMLDVYTLLLNRVCGYEYKGEFISSVVKHRGDVIKWQRENKGKKPDL